MKRTILLNLILLLLTVGFAQKKEPVTVDRWSGLGFDFHIGGGIYFADSKTAQYYNGDPSREVNLGLLFDNKYRYDEITQLIINNYPYVDSIWFDPVDLPQKMKYSLGMSLGLGMKYQFHKNWGFMINYSHIRLTASDVFLIRFPQPSGNIRNDYAMEYLKAVEERSFFDIGITHTFHVHPTLRPFLEMGLQFNYIKVRSFEAIIEDRPFNLLYSVSTPYVPGQQTTPNYRNWAAPGYGLSFSGGIKIIFNQIFSLDPVAYFSISSMGHSDNLIGYDQGFTFNYGIMIRLVMSDLYFSH
jgi:hypothetical protein